jgi:hypothetical protein
MRFIGGILIELRREVESGKQGHLPLSTQLAGGVGLECKQENVGLGEATFV